VGDDNGRPFIAMEYIEGFAIADAGPLSIDAGVRYGVEADDALAHAHERGIVHGDLKAANVMIARSARLKIVDFGLAHRVERHGGEVATTVRTGRAMVAGTPYAMAPEQVRGVMADELSDVWGLGVILFEMLTGVQPFDASTIPELFSSILRDS